MQFLLTASTSFIREEETVRRSITDKAMERQQQALQLWDQAGERPWEVLEESGVYDDFLVWLQTQSIDPEYSPVLYRGTARHSELQVGDVHQYTYTTSWSEDEEIGLRFTEECYAPVLFVLRLTQPAPGAYNTYNIYEESEAILPPCCIRVVERIEEDGYVRLVGEIDSPSYLI